MSNINLQSELALLEGEITNKEKHLLHLKRRRSEIRNKLRGVPSDSSDLLPQAKILAPQNEK